MTLVCEARPGRPIHDWVLELLPYSRWLALHNYQFWALTYLPLALALWWRDRPSFVRFLWWGGVLSLVRGLTIVLVPLGPVEGPDLNVGMSAARIWHAWLGIVNPVSALGSDVATVSLTKDLFFSGHASSTLLLWLYCRPHRWLGPLALLAHLFAVATILLGRIHYSIDVVGAWLVTWLLWRLAEHWRARSSPGPKRLP
jgi:hypothetical protein